MSRTPETAEILIVDDEERNCRLLEALLRPEGYVTRCAAGGREALASVAEDPPDLILLDLRMPEMDGGKVAAALKADPATRGIPIIMVTAQADREARLAALDAGTEDFLTKPVDRAELWLRVRNLLRLKQLNDFLAHHRALLEREVLARTADLQRFRTAMDSTGDAIFLVDRNTMEFVEVNATASEMLGYSHEELLQLGPVDLEPTSAAPMAKLPGGARHESTRSTETVRRKDGSSLAVEAHRHVQRFGDDWIIVSVLRDVTEREEAGKRLEHLAHFDALTGLPNRTLFYETLKQSLLTGSPPGWTTAVLFIDLDHFKNVNDTLGHAFGDELLIEVSSRLVGCLRDGETVGRLGGDEFGLILVMQEGATGAALIAGKVQDALREPFELNGHELTVTASIGITLHPDDADEPETLIKYADTAMYQAKQAGRDTIRFFTTQMNAEALARLELEIALRRAVKNGEFVLHYQPKARLEDGTVAGLEALLRWERPGQGLVPPNQFIPALEESGLIVDVGSWVIDAVCRQIARWRHTPVGPVHVSLNVAGRQLMEGDLEGDVSRALEAHGVPADLLELELTESTLMVNTDRTIATLGSLRARGVRISIDDFGTGYSSLAYLRRFPIDKLKIDISFIREVTTNADDAAISLAIIQMAHSLNMDVIAEGVETEAQLAYLRRHRCDQIQGYYFRKPLTADAVEELLLRGGGLPARAVSEPSHATLLLVDDDPHVLHALEVLLGDDGYRILTATSALEGLNMLALHDVQVLLCDERMPEMTGTDFLARVKEIHPDALRILLSSGADEAAFIASINRGEVYRYYTKPWDAAELRSNLRQAFHHYWKLQDERAAVPSVAPSSEAGPALDHPASRRRGAGPLDGANEPWLPDPAGERPAILNGPTVDATDSADIVTTALRTLLRIRSPQAAADLLQATAQKLGATLVLAADAPPHALPIDLSLGEGPPLLAVVEPFSLARLQLEHILPRLTEDARQAVDLLRHTERLKVESNHDEHTGLASRRTFDPVLARADDGPVVIDIGLHHLKRITDTSGPAAGDGATTAADPELRALR